MNEPVPNLKLLTPNCSISKCQLENCQPGGNIGRGHLVKSAAPPNVADCPCYVFWHLFVDFPTQLIFCVLSTYTYSIDKCSDNWRIVDLQEILVAGTWWSCQPLPTVFAFQSHQLTLVDRPTQLIFILVFYLSTYMYKLAQRGHLVELSTLPTVFAFQTYQLGATWCPPTPS